MGIAGMIRRKMNEMKANTAAKRLTAEKVAAERRRSHERQELEKVRIQEKAALAAYTARASQKPASKAEAIRQTVARFGAQSSSPFSPAQAAPRGSDSTRSILGMGGAQQAAPAQRARRKARRRAIHAPAPQPAAGDKTREIFGMGKKRNVFYD